MKTVIPKTFLLGYSDVDFAAIIEYLEYSGQREFIADWQQASKEGISNGEVLCSFYAKMCYAALTTKKNLNISRTRAVKDNLIGTLANGHGSVFEHFWINFITTDCSRVFTHELVRHRVGTAFSQTSGRYVRIEDPSIVFDPILKPIEGIAAEFMDAYNAFITKATEALKLNESDNFDYKKKATSALRRFGFNGQSNEIGWSANIRTLRQLIMLRTSRHAEWEIRLVFNQVYELLKAKVPLMFHDAKERMVDGCNEVYGMVLQPFEKES